MKSNNVSTCLQVKLDADGVYGSPDTSRGTTQIQCFDLHRAMRLPEVLRVTGLSRSAWYARLNPKLPTFDSEAPRPFKLGKSKRSPSAWWAWEILAFLEAKSMSSRVH